MPFDYRKLEGLVKEKCRTRAIFAYKMGLSERSISLKMNGKHNGNKPKSAQLVRF